MHHEFDVILLFLSAGTHELHKKMYAYMKEREDK